MQDTAPVSPEPEQPLQRAEIGALRLHAAWYALALSEEVGARPLKRTLYGAPIALFRDKAGVVGALQDRCPHRSVPLSGGEVVDGCLQCPYHGWRFAADGRCVEVPGLLRAGGDEARSAAVHPVREREGVVWVWGEANGTPVGEPRSLAPPGPGYSEVRRVVDFPGSLWATAENALDVPHTAYLHRGLFRGAGERNEIEAVVTRDETSTTAHYHGEPRPGGLAARILAPAGGQVEHYDRFELPGIAIVDYRLGDELHFRVLTLLTPLEDFRTRATAVIQFRLRLPHWAVKLVLGPVAMRIFRQDAEILAAQTATVARFGGERYISTEIDILGAQIRRLIERAAAGIEPKPGRPWERRIKLRV